MMSRVRHCHESTVTTPSQAGCAVGLERGPGHSGGGPPGGGVTAARGSGGVGRRCRPLAAHYPRRGPGPRRPPLTHAESPDIHLRQELEGCSVGGAWADPGLARTRRCSPARPLEAPKGPVGGSPGRTRGGLGTQPRGLQQRRSARPAEGGRRHRPRGGARHGRLWPLPAEMSGRFGLESLPILWSDLVRVHPGRPAAHLTASTGWDEELRPRTAGV